MTPEHIQFPIRSLRELRDQGEFDAANAFEDALVRSLRASAVEADLGEIGKGSSHPHILELADGLKVVFKTSPGFGIRKIGDWWAAYLEADEAAYWISRELGMNLVPPTVIRTLDGQKGVISVFIPDATEPDENDKKSNALNAFDYLIRNYDRKPDNYLLVDDQEVAIDHGWALRKVALQEYKARQKGRSVGGDFLVPFKDPWNFQLEPILIENMESILQNPSKFLKSLKHLRLNSDVLNTLLKRLREIVNVQLRDPWHLSHSQFQKIPSKIPKGYYMLVTTGDRIYLLIDRDTFEYRYINEFLNDTDVQRRIQHSIELQPEV